MFVWELGAESARRSGISVTIAGLDGGVLRDGGEDSETSGGPVGVISREREVDASALDEAVDTPEYDPFVSRIILPTPPASRSTSDEFMLTSDESGSSMSGVGRSTGIGAGGLLTEMVGSDCRWVYDWLVTLPKGVVARADDSSSSSTSARTGIGTSAPEPLPAIRCGETSGFCNDRNNKISGCTQFANGYVENHLSLLRHGVDRLWD